MECIKSQNTPAALNMVTLESFTLLEFPSEYAMKEGADGGVPIPLNT